MNNFIETQVEKAIKDYEEKIGKYGYDKTIEQIVKQTVIATCDKITTVDGESYEDERNKMIDNSNSSSSWTMEYKDAKEVTELCNIIKPYTKKRGREKNSNWIKRKAIRFIRAITDER